MYFCNKPNYALLKALSLNRCESFNVPIGDCSRKREREDSDEDCISAKVPRLFGAYVPKVVTLPRESSPPLISPSPLPWLQSLLWAGKPKRVFADLKQSWDARGWFGSNFYL